MRTIKIFLVLVVAIALISCASSRSLERGAQGAALGAGIGYLAGKGPGAVAGGLIGGAVGSVIGTVESDKGLAIGGKNGPTPLPWIRGERVIVATQGWSWGDSIRAIIEDELRGKGAIVVSSPGRSFSNQQDLGSAYLAEVYSDRQGDNAIVQIRIIDRTNNVLKATGTGRSEIYNAYYYGSGGDYRSFEIAARCAINNLH